MNLISRFIRDESGATAIEYGLIAALIAVVVIGGVTSRGRQARQHLQQRFGQPEVSSIQLEEKGRRKQFPPPFLLPATLTR